MKSKCSLLLKGLLPIVSIAILIIFACNKGKETSATPSSKDSAVILEQADTMENGLVLPAGSSLTIFASKPKTIYAVLPDGFALIGTTTGGQPLNIEVMDITCDCSSGSGCNPFINSRASGCVTFGGCSKCTQTTSTHAGRQQNTAETIGEGAVIDLSLGIRFITQSAEMTATPPILTAMLQDSSILRALQTFLAPYQQHDLSQVRAGGPGTSLPPGYRLMPISLYGRSLLVPVEEAITPACAITDIHPGSGVSTKTVDEEAVTGGYSCSCGAGTGCSYHSMWIPWAGMTYYCSSGVCTSCTLHTPQ